LPELIDCTATHFSSEEATLEKLGYPSLAAHRAEHRALLEKVRSDQDEYLDGKAGMASSLMNFLVEWLKQQILRTDKTYSQFPNEHRVR
jgi:hemerythrin